MTGKNENEELSLADQLAKDWDAAAAGDAEDRVSDNEPVAPAPSGDTPASDDAAVAAKEGETETPAAEPKVDATGRHHGADGKFVPKNPDGTVKTKD